MTTPLSELVKGQVDICYEESSQDKGKIFFTVSLNGTAWGTPVPAKTDKAKLSAMLDEKTAEKVATLFDKISGEFDRAFEKNPGYQKFRAIQNQVDITPHEAFVHLYGTPENMEGYMDGNPRPPETSTKTYIRDAVRFGPVDGMEDVPAYDRATPWSGMIGYRLPTQENPKAEVLGRAANGGGRVNGYSESGIFIEKEQRGSRHGRSGIVALFVHAWFFSKMRYPVGEHEVKRFTGTISPESKRALAFIEGINTELKKPVITNQNPTKDFAPYGKEAPRDLYGIDAGDIDKVIHAIGIEKIFVNGKPASAFFEAKKQNPDDDNS